MSSNCFRFVSSIYLPKHLRRKPLLSYQKIRTVECTININIPCFCIYTSYILPTANWQFTVVLDFCRLCPWNLTKFWKCPLNVLEFDLKCPGKTPKMSWNVLNCPWISDWKTCGNHVGFKKLKDYRGGTFNKIPIFEPCTVLYYCYKLHNTIDGKIGKTRKRAQIPNYNSCIPIQEMNLQKKHPMILLMILQ